MAMSLPRPVTAATASAGPTMYETSTAIESSANAVRRWSAGTMAATYWRMRPKIGGQSTPATNPSPTNAPNPRLGAAIQKAPWTTVVTANTGRAPTRSMRRPARGEPTPTPAMIDAPARPACAYPRFKRGHHVQRDDHAGGGRRDAGEEPDHHQQAQAGSPQHESVRSQVHLRCVPPGDSVCLGGTTLRHRLDPASESGALVGAYRARRSVPCMLRRGASACAGCRRRGTRARRPRTRTPRRTRPGSSAR